MTNEERIRISDILKVIKFVTGALCCLLIDNKTSLNRGTAAIPLSCFSHKKVSTPFYLFEVVVC